MSDQREHVVFGGTSGIAMAWCRLEAEKGAAFRLVGRSGERLEAAAADLLARGASSCHTHQADLACTEEIDAVLETLPHTRPSVVLLAHGLLGDQAEIEQRPALALELLRLNLDCSIYLLLRITPWLEEKGCRRLVVLGSVAGDRGRAENSVYGASKAGLEAFCSGLAARLEAGGVKLLFVKAGPVRTAMTAHLDLGPAAIESKGFARRLQRALRSQRVFVYIPRRWGLIFLVLRHLPFRVFLRLFPARQARTSASDG